MPYFSFRLTTSQAQLIYVGLRQLAVNYEYFIKTGKLLDSHPELRIRFLPPSTGKFSQSLMDVIMILWQKIRPIRDRGGRLHKLGSFEIAACILAVRVALRRVQHGHVTAWMPRLENCAKRLLRRLENERKSQKRAFINSQGSDEFRSQSRGWTAFVRWLRFHFLFCRCNWRPWTGHIYKSQRRLVSRCHDLAKAEIIERKDTLPTDKDLRHFVRLGLRNVRRGRTHFGILQLANDDLLVRTYFSNFVFLRTQIFNR